MSGFWQAFLTGSTEKRDAGDVTDIGIAFKMAIAEALGHADETISAVYRGQQLLTDVVASLPLEAVDGKGETHADLFPVLAEPGLDETYHDTMASIMASLIWDGNAYLRTVKRDALGLPTKFQVLDPGEVNVAWDNLKVYRQYSWRDTTLLDGKDIFHIAINRWPGKEKGVGPITAARLAIQGSKAEQQFAISLFEDGGSIPYAITVPEKVTSGEAQAILNSWLETHQGKAKPGVLGGGAGVTPLGLKPVDAEFLLSRNFSVQEIARFLGIPGFFLGVEMGSSLTYSTTESLFRLMLTATLNPTYLERIQATFTRMLPKGYKARFNSDEILRADILTRYQAQAAAIKGGFKTQNEVRREEGMKPLPGGDALQTPSGNTGPTNSPESA